MQCKYSDKLFIRAYALYEAYKNDPERLGEEFAKAFTDPEVALNTVKNWIKGETVTPPPSSKTPITSIQLDIDENDVGSYFADTAKYNQLKSFFKERILANTILSINLNNGEYDFIDGNAFVEGTNITIAQENILNFKNDLLNLITAALKIEPANLNIGSSDEEVTNAINTVLTAYGEYLHDNPTSEGDVYNAYVILKNFDSLLQNNSPYIKIDPSYLKAGIEGVTKYSLVPKVEHYSGYSGKDESADIMKQVSNLAGTILSLVPEIDAKGRILPSYIGTAGYNGAMETLKQALLYTTQFGEDTYKFRESFHKGESAFLDPNNPYNLSNLIDAFVSINTVNSKSTSDFSRFRQTYIHNKLRGINYFLFGDRTPAYVKNMFSRMFYKTEPTSYRVYQTDETGMFGAKSLESKMILTQKFAIQNIVNGGFNTIHSTNVADNIISKYNPIITRNGDVEQLSLTTETGRTFSVDYKIGNKIEVGNTTENTDILKDFLQDAFSYTLPEDYATCMGETNYKWENDFLPFVIIGSKLALQRTKGKYGLLPSNIYNMDGTINIKSFNNTFLKIGERLGIIYGDSVKSVVSSLSGSKLPLFQLTSLEYNWQSCLYDAKNNPITSQINNVLFSDEDLLLLPQIRNEVEVNGKIKSAVVLNQQELNKMQILDDFFFPYLLGGSDIDSGIYLQNAVFSDKARHFLPGWRLNKTIKNAVFSSIFGTGKTLKDIITESLNDNGEKLQEVARILKRDRHVLVARNLIQDYAEVFPSIFKPLALTSDGDTNAKNALKVLSEINKYISENFRSVDDLRKAFLDAGVNFKEEVHASTNNLTKKVSINETFYNFLNASSSKENWETRINFLKAKEKRNLASTILNGFDDSLKRKSNRDDKSSYFDLLVNWKPTNRKDYNGFYNPNTKEFSFINKDGELHSIANTYFYLNLILNGEYNTLTLGELWAHPNKNKTKDADNYLEFSEASRYVNQIKRSVINGSTIHSFAQGILNEEGKANGVTEKIHIAIVKDRKAAVATPKGVESTIDSQDGAGRCTALQARLENNSVVDAYAGENKKTILHDIDAAYNTPVLLKWAVYAITNNLRRLSYSANDSLELQTRKMYSLDFNKNIDLAQEYWEYVNKNGTIWIQDPLSLEYEELIGFIENNGVYTQYLRSVDGTVRAGRNYDTTQNHTLYDIDQIFGGCFTFSREGNSFIGNEASVDMLEKIAIRYDLRDKQIAYVVNTSACKVGAENVNPVSSLADNTPFYTFDLSTKYGGIMMDADHELAEGEVTEMTQMISSLIESGLCLQEAKEVYEDIGNIVWNNDKVQRFVSVLDTLKNADASAESKEQARQALNTLVGRSFVESFSTGSKDTIGLAQAFSKKFLDAAKNGESFSLPFSDATLYGGFVANVISLFNKGAIRRKYEGFAAVQNPGYNNVMYYKNGLLFPEFNEQCKSVLSDRISYIEGQGFTGLDYTGENHFYSSYADLASNAWIIGGELNPFLKEINKREIEFEDTVYIKENGVITKYYVDNFETYDILRNLKDYAPDAVIYVNTAAPKNLKGTDTVYTVYGIDATGNSVSLGTYSYYNNDSVRAAHYLDNPKKNDPYAEKKAALIQKLGVTTVAECNQLTQDFLNALKFGKQFNQAVRAGEDVGDLANKASISAQDAFGDTSNYVSFYCPESQVIPAEIIIGRYQLEKIGIEKTDKISDITSSEFFERKILNNLQNVVFSLDEETQLSVYDKVIYHNGVPFLVKIGKEGSHLTDGVQFNDDPAFSTLGEDFRYNGEVIVSGVEGIKGATVSDGTYSYNYINIATEDDFEKLIDSDYFEDIYRNNVDSNNLEKERNRFLGEVERLANDKYESFKEASTYIGARIPTQNMQSYMPFKVVAYTDSEKNEIYLPKQNTYLTGSDYDIDKLYLLTVSILKNGTLRSGSSLQRNLGYYYASKLFKPNEVNFVEGENGTGVRSFIVENLSKPVREWTKQDKETFIYIANKINSDAINGTATVTFQTPVVVDTEWETKKANFLKLLNKHSHTNSYLRDSSEALKTRIFKNIKNITLSPEVQLKAQIAVDECTGEFKARAASTTSGSAEKQVTSDLATSLFIMQVQNMLGKSVVGIGAVSLKTYYLLSYMANIKADKARQYLKEGKLSEAIQEVISMMLNNPILRQPTFLANTNTEGLLEGFRSFPQEAYGNLNKEVFLGQLETAIRNSKAVNASDYLSGIISLGADNAKDLALPKLNATADLVDFYTTSFMLGTPFKNISDIMTSEMFNWITEIGKDNIFDDSTRGNKVKKMIEELLADKIPGFEKGTEGRVVQLYNSWAKKHGKELLQTKDFTTNTQAIAAVIDAFENSDLMTYAPERITSEMWDAYYQALEEAEQNSDGGRVKVNVPWTTKDLYKVYKSLQILSKKLEYLQVKKNAENLNTLGQLLDAADKMSTLGRMASVNGGLRTDISAFLNYGKNIDMMPITAGDNPVLLDFNRFLTDTNYAQQAIQLYSTNFSGTFNILEALYLSPNFYNMAKVYGVAKDVLDNTSYVFKKTDAIVNDLLNNKKVFYLSDKAYKEINRYLNDTMIYKFLLNSSFSLNLEELANTIKRPVEVYKPNGVSEPVANLTFSNAMDIASFKHIMEQAIIPYLKMVYKDNPFVRDLNLTENRRLKSFTYSLPLQMMEIDADESSLAKYNQYLTGFNSIAKDTVAGNNIGDLFFLYNLIVNKNSYGNQSLTRIFENLVNSKNSPAGISAYYRFIGQLDSGNMNYEIPIKEVAYRLGKYADTSVNEPISFQFMELPKDCTFDLPMTGGLISQAGVEIKTKLSHFTPLGNLSARDIINTFADKLNYNKKVVSTFRDESKTSPKAFIQNGLIHFNLAKLDAKNAIGVGMHELSHFVFAAIKNKDVTDPNRVALYALLDKVRTGQDIETYAKYYPWLTGTDLEEEVLCNKIETVLTGKLSDETEIDLANNKIVLEGLKTLFPDGVKDLSEIVGLNLEEAVEKFAYSVFNFMGDISQDYMLKNQKVGWLKTYLINKTDKNNKLEQDCNG